MPMASQLQPMDIGPRPSPKRMTAKQRRAQIIEAAITLFGRHGFKGATTRALAEALGVSEATIFKHFPTKGDLYAAAFEHRTGVGGNALVSELQGFMDRQDDEGLLRTLFRAVLDGYEKDRDLHRMLMYAYLEQEGDAAKRLWTQMQRYPLFTFLDHYVRRRQAEGAFVSDAPGLLASALLTLPAQHAISTRLYGVDAEHSDDVVVETFARLLLDGARTRPQTTPPE